MKAVVYHGPGDIRLDNIPEPTIQDSGDAIVALTQSAICGTDLHMIRDTMPGMQPGTVLGHEGVGIVEEVGPDMRNFARGDRVVIASTIACGACPTAGMAITHNATMPTQTAKGPALPSMVPRL
jgi:threonine dehydrogenase-like Zn-dependent dehydrogenase